MRSLPALIAGNNVDLEPVEFMLRQVKSRWGKLLLAGPVANGWNFLAICVESIRMSSRPVTSGTSRRKRACFRSLRSIWREVQDFLRAPTTEVTRSSRRLTRWVIWILGNGERLGRNSVKRFWRDEGERRGMLIHRAGGANGATWRIEYGGQAPEIWRAGPRREGSSFGDPSLRRGGTSFTPG
jgi:hypothetical protein